MSGCYNQSRFINMWLNSSYSWTYRHPITCTGILIIEIYSTFCWHIFWHKKIRAYLICGHIFVGSTLSWNTCEQFTHAPFILHGICRKPPHFTGLCRRPIGQQEIKRSWLYWAGIISRTVWYLAWIHMLMFFADIILFVSRLWYDFFTCFRCWLASGLAQ